MRVLIFAEFQRRGCFEIRLRHNAFAMCRGGKLDACACAGAHVVSLRVVVRRGLARRFLLTAR